MTPGEALRAARERRGLSIEELAHASHVSALTIARAEKDVAPLTREDSRKLANGLGMKLHALMRGAA